MLSNFMERRQRPARPSPRPTTAGSRWVFMREFLRSPRGMGTVFPCSPAVAQAMVRDLDTSKWSAAAELGPGDGVLTPTLIAGLPTSCTFFAVELSTALAEKFRDRLPGVELVEADATALPSICRDRKLNQLDAIFSALPLRLFSPTALSHVLHAASLVLRPGGVFAQVTYWPAALTPGKQIREQCASVIGPVQSDKLVAGNAPPAWVFRCTKPSE